MSRLGGDAVLLLDQEAIDSIRGYRYLLILSVSLKGMERGILMVLCTYQNEDAQIGNYSYTSQLCSALG